MDNALLQEAQTIEAEFKVLEAKRALVREQLLNLMVKGNITKLGGYTVGRRTLWNYTDSVKKLEEKVKLAKVKEQQKGLAEEGTTEYLVFTPSI